MNLKKNDPGLADNLKSLKRDIFTNLNCHAIAMITKFDPATQLCAAKMNYKRTIWTLTSNPLAPDTYQYTPKYVEYPLIVSAPLVVVGGGNVNLTMPVQAGDQALVFFNDRSLDDWYRNGAVNNLSDLRTHSFSDALVLVGLHSKLNPIQNYDTVRGGITDGDAFLGVNPTTSKIAIENNAQNLKTMLDTWFAQFKVFVVQFGGGGTTISGQTDVLIAAINALLE